MLKQLFRVVALAVLLTAVVANRAAAAEEQHSTGTGTPAHVEGGHEKGEIMPDATKASSVLQALWVIIIFLIMLAILYPTAWKNVLAGLKAREERIRSDIAEAEAARNKAEATLREYNTQLATAEQRVRDLIAGAQADGERIAAQIRVRGEQEAQEAKERATKEIEAATKQAIAEIYEQAAVLATSVAEKILRRELKSEDQRDLVARSLDQVQNIKNN
jgi:F-type H+-transporting ATPase subunit b